MSKYIPITPGTWKVPTDKPYAVCLVNKMNENEIIVVEYVPSIKEGETYIKQQKPQSHYKWELMIYA